MRPNYERTMYFNGYGWHHSVIVALNARRVSCGRMSRRQAGDP